ncbi:DUF3108 domain-containing protein [Paraglaciecola sp. L3A3]|uniref:DUF3108 domain-containing protein n=1 Tax=Paraglaciecola sp. L3A3 TaxID=2686358 RepID=UPI00131DB8F1|nr:DUF3108 domain-containing protein [Paraglaciecola sp. L3A3]
MLLAKLKVFGLITLFILTSTSSFAANTATPTLKNFKAEYSAYRFGRDLGEASLTLTSLEDNLYQLDYHSKVSAFFLSDERTENSTFSFESGQITPQMYLYTRTGTGSDKKTSVQFTDSQIKINNSPPIDWEGQLDNQLYRLDVQLKLAAGHKSFSYDLINSRGQERHYDLKVVGKEMINVPFGAIEAIKVIFERKNSTRKTWAWFSPKLNYQLVMLQQFKDGDEQGELRLKSITFSDK